MGAIKETTLHFDNLTNAYHGKVRDVYFFGDKLAMIVSDRISAFDVILPRAIPFKGQVLNQIAAKNLKSTEDIVPNWLLATPNPRVSVGLACKPFAVEMVIRGYLAGHAWREYSAGKRTLCGVALPDGLKENDKLPAPIITPTTKAMEGHDADISREEIIAQKTVSESDYLELERLTKALFQRGTELAEKQGLILVDTKYEFGKIGDTIYLIDEIHTPDSSRYFYASEYEKRQAAGVKQKQLSKEFVREWLMENGFQGKEGQSIPEMTDEVLAMISNRYIELYEQFTGSPFERSEVQETERDIEKSINECLKSL